MMRKEILFALALGSCLGGATAFAQDNSAGAAAPAATPDASAAPAAGDDAIHLHMPVHHRTVHAHASLKPAENAAPAEAPTIDSIGADTPASPAAAAPLPTSTETPSPAQPAPAKATKSDHAPAKQSAPTIPFTFGEDSGIAQPQASVPSGNREPQAAASTHETKTASLPPRPEIPKLTPVPARPAKQAVRAKEDEHAGLAKRGAVLFDKGMSNPSAQQFDGLKLLAGELSTALEAGRGPVQLEAFAGVRGDKTSDARRLSLKRAIAVRQLLIDNGLPSNRIIVRAEGGVDDNGPNDRVDVYIRAS